MSAQNKTAVTSTSVKTAEEIAANPAEVITAAYPANVIGDAFVASCNGHAAAIRMLMDDCENPFAGAFGRYRGKRFTTNGRLTDDPKSVAYYFAGARFNLVETSSKHWIAEDTADCVLFDQDGRRQLHKAAKTWKTERADFATVERYATMRAAANVVAKLDAAEIKFSESAKNVSAADYTAVSDENAKLRAELEALRAAAKK